MHACMQASTCGDRLPYSRRPIARRHTHPRLRSTLISLRQTHYSSAPMTRLRECDRPVASPVGRATEPGGLRESRAAWARAKLSLTLCTNNSRYCILLSGIGAAVLTTIFGPLNRRAEYAIPHHQSAPARPRGAPHSRANTQQPRATPVCNNYKLICPPQA